MEHTANIINLNKGLTPSLLNLFAVFELHLIDDIDKVESVDIMCINCKKETVLYLGTSLLELMITEFVLNSILHNVGMSWIINFIHFIYMYAWP